MNTLLGKILIVDDNPVNIRILTETLEEQGYEIYAAAHGDQALKLARRVLPDLILLDVVMPGRDGYTICRLIKAEVETRDIPVLFITAKMETESIVRGFKCGAVDYIAKPFQGEEVVARVQTHLRLTRLTREIKERNQELEAEIARRQQAEAAHQVVNERLTNLSAQEAKRWGIETLIGQSPLFRQIVSDIERLNRFANISVLITGESGTGKELVARAIHYGSLRRDAPFVPINCVAIPAELTESTFFGHLRGSFTGATADRKGCFELADGGTLFLDEIGDMPAPLQAKLLRVLEDGQITPIGATKPKKVDVRIVAATNALLEQKIASGEFRQDLFYRLARFTVPIPALREHPEDILLLCTHFLTLFALEMNLPQPSLSTSAQSLLLQHTYPGNVRELKNIIERALIESGGKTICPEHLQLSFPQIKHSLLAKTSFTQATTNDTIPLNLKEAEQKLIQRALQESEGNVTEAARRLGVNRSRIYRKYSSASPNHPSTSS